MTTYLIHKAVEFNAVTAKARKALGATSVDDLSATHFAQRKYDGCNGILVVKPNEQFLLSRTGEVVRSCDHIKRAGRALLANHLDRGRAFVLLGEVWRPGVEQAVISGEFRKHDPVPALQFIVFDMLTLEEYLAGCSDREFADRHTRMSINLRGQHLTDTIRMCETYTPGSYGNATGMCRYLVGLGGYDGLILRKPDGKWQASSGTTGEIIKVKERISFDLRVLAVVEGKGRNVGRCGSLMLRGPKGHVSVNSGTDKQREDWYADPSQIVGKIVEVFCLGFTNTGSLREPTLGEVRHDKEKADYE